MEMLPSKKIKRKFEEIYDIEDYEIWTDTGWQDVVSIGKTIPYQIYHLILENGLELKCADTHIVFSNNKEIFVKDLQIGYEIDTEIGISKVKELKILDEYDNMYDVYVPNGNRFYSNGILSHNTTVISIDALHFAMFNEDKVVGIAANNAVMATEILDRIKLVYEELPMWIKPGIKEYNKTSLWFENGSRIVARPCSPNSFRGFSLARLICDEFHFISSQKLAEQFWLSNYPTISSSKEAKIILISTPNGMSGLFYEIWQDGVKGKNLFKCYEANWQAIPGRDEKWKKDQIATIGAKRFSQEFDVKFLGSSSTIIDGNVLKKLMEIDDNPISYGLNDRLRIYEQPKQKTLYMLGIDTGKGTNSDDSVIQILKIISLKPLKVEQVAVFQSNKTDTFLFAEIVFKLALLYNNAYVVIENNAEGDTIIKRMWWDFQYENLVNEGGTLQKLGVRATKKSKPAAVMLMKKLIEEDNCILHDRNTIKQLCSFVEEKGKLWGQDGTHDDLVTSLYWACYGFTFDLFDGDTEIIKQKEIEEEAWGIVGDSDPDDIENFWNEG